MHKVEILNHSILEEENYKKLWQEYPELLTYIREEALGLSVGERHGFSLRALKEHGWLCFYAGFRVLESEDGGHIQRVILEPCVFEHQPR
ncbi:hypothetical protein HB818_03785 [Listeria booriae]|uniref:Uncharacterized protein n=1 Tax=Listeria booriae TaxID=1552123 RepID=A0A841X245_9LIST|nr:hypothetical protein [Listeria booriae]MBC1284885.1 hypothetical protein [Listeria booriae]MBC1565069.1 hypothetical protein [Listeria booriae]